MAVAEMANTPKRVRTAKRHVLANERGRRRERRTPHTHTHTHTHTHAPYVFTSVCGDEGAEGWTNRVEKGVRQELEGG